MGACPYTTKASRLPQQAQSSKHPQHHIHGWSGNHRAKIEPCNVNDRPPTLWNLPSRLPCRFSKGSEACHLHNRVQSNMGDRCHFFRDQQNLGVEYVNNISSELAWNCWWNANELSFARNDRPPSLDSVERGLVAPPSSLMSATMASCTIAKAKEVCRFSTQWKVAT
jgi:hypothetical protein